MEESTLSFGYWIRRRRMAIDLTQAELARLVGCAPVTIRKIEADERRPSRLMAERLAESLSIPANEVNRFIQTARGELSPVRSPSANQPIRISKSEAVSSDELQHEYPDRTPYPFVGREQELSAMLDHLQIVQQGDGQVVFISGEAGRGKTTLLIEFARRAITANPDLIVASGNCNAFGGTGDPFLPFRDVLNQLVGDIVPGWDQRVLSREHARRVLAFAPNVLRTLAAEGPDLIRVFLPEMVAAGLLRLDGDSGRNLRLAAQQEFHSAKRDPLFLFEQFTQVFHTLSRQHTLLILLDDLQWADSATISLLFHLGMRLVGTRMLIACAHRSSEIFTAGDNEGLDQASSHELNNLVNEFRRRFGDVWYDLSQVEENENWHFLNAFLDTEPNKFNDDFRRAFFQQTQGHPLFTIEMLRDMQARGDIIQDESGDWILVTKTDWETLPARVEAIIRQRIGNLSQDLREILSTAGVEGETFTAQVIAQILNKDERTILHQLSRELESKYRLVRVVGEVETLEGVLTRYRFQHVLFQEYLYRQMSRAECRLLHREIANVLERLYGLNSGEIVVELAHHFRQSGVKGKALEYTCRAAERAEVMFAYDEAVQHLHYALELLPPGEENAIRLSILEQLADDYVLLGERPRAISLYERALDTIDRSDDESRMDAVRLHRKVGETIAFMNLFEDRRRFADKGTKHFQAGLKLVKDKPAHPETVRLLITMANEAWFSRSEPDWKTAEEFALQANHMAEQLDSPVEISLALDVLANVYGGRGLFRERLAVSLRRLELSRNPVFRDIREQADILQQTGFAYSQVGEYQKALPFLIEAEELSSQIQDLFLIYRAMRHQTTCYYRLDEWDKVLEVEAKRQSLEKRYPNFSERVGST